MSEGTAKSIVDRARILSRSTENGLCQLAMTYIGNM